MGRPGDMGPDEADPNEVALARFKLVPRVMKARAHIDVSMDFCGRRIAAPLAVGAYAADRLFAADGVLPVARVCAALNLPLMISEECLTPLDSITAVHDDCWLQIRGAGPAERYRELIDAAAGAGARGLLVSLLAPTHIRPGLYPGGVNIGAEIAARSLRTIADRVDPRPVPPFPSWTWTDLADAAEYAARRGLPVVAKGVLDPRDAVLAFENGCAAVMVSNMGVRNLGRWVPAPAQLPAISSAAGSAGRPLILDGGIRTAPDIVVARALGADLASLVRPVVLALVNGGEDGVMTLLSGFLDEIISIISWLGCETLADLDGSHVVST
jgi:4-hydroxymandelate oxidase